MTAEEMLEGLRDAMHTNPNERNYEDIARVLAGWFVPSENYDEREGVWLVEFKDGARVAMFGWHDSTGWDCQSGLDFYPFDAWRGEIEAHRGSYEVSNWSVPVDEVIASIEAQLEAAR